MNIRKALLSILLFSISVYLPVLGQQYNFTNYSIDQGLVQSQVNTIFEDSKGYLWIGTNGGISMFDGFRFINFTKDQGLSDNQVRAIGEDLNGNIWIGTKEGYVCCFNGASFICLNDKNGLLSPSIISIARDSSGTMYFASERNGIFFLKENNFQNFKIPALKDVAIKTITFDYKGKLWIGTLNNGIYIYNKENVQHLSVENGLSDNHVLSLHEDIYNYMWISTKNGATKYKDGSVSSYRQEDGISSDNINAIITEKKGQIWFGTEKGISKFDGKAFVHYNKTNGLDNDNITCLLRDRTQNIWIGTDRGGIYKYDGDRFVHLTMKDGLPNNIVLSIMQDWDNNFWFGTYGDGVCKYDGSKFTIFSTKDGLCSNVINSIFQDKEGNIWFGSKGNGLSKYDGKKFTSYSTDNGLNSNMVYSISQDHEGHILIGTLGGGLNIFDGKKFTIISKNEGLSSNMIYFIYSDKNGNIYIGTDDAGVDLIFNTTISEIINSKKVGSDNILNISRKFGLANEQVLSIAEDTEGNIWFGTYGGGVCKFDGKEIKTITTKDGINSNNIFFLLTDSRGYIWAGSEKGINRMFFSNNQSKPSIKTYSKGEGYRGIESSLNAAIEDNKGYLWFATIKGVSRYDASADLPNPIEPITRIINVKLFSENINWSMYSSETSNDGKVPLNITLPHNKNHLTFDFIGIDLKSPDKVKYQWMLEGYDKTWSAVTISTTTVAYSFIPEGEYVFRVRSCNNDGVWNKMPASIRIVIKPPFWTTWWFIVLVVIVVLFLVLLFIRIRFSYLENINKTLEEKIQIRTALLRQEKATVEEQAKLLQHQKLKLEDINKELEKLSIVARETDNSVMIADNQCRVQWVNEGFHKLFGYESSDFNDIFGQHIAFSSNFKDIEKVINDCIEKKTSVVYASQSHRKDGQIIWVQTTLTPIYDTAGHLKQLVAIDTDISKIKLAEEQIKLEKEKSDNLLLNILPT